MHHRRTILANAMAMALILHAQAAEVPPPRLDVELTPKAHSGKVDAVQVKLRVEAPGVAAGQMLLRMPLVVVGIPTAAYSAEAITVNDAAGPLTLRGVDEAPTPTATYRQYLADRATVGDVSVSYVGTPRQVNAQTPPGPFFDLRTEGDGLLGAGVYFLALPPEDRPYRIGMTWRLEGLPTGTRGIWSLGEGEQHTVGPTQTLAYSIYATGPVKSEPEDGKGDFGLYWLTTSPFDMRALAKDTRALYRYMAKFFNDEQASYRIFARRNPYPAGGGNALEKSFIFGYGGAGESAVGGDQLLLAHEMAHNWPRLDDNEDNVETAWYTEGTAEFYSSALALRAGVIDLDKFITLVNGRAAEYAGNPFKSLSNSEVGKLFWKDARAQRLPYGRGFMYLARVDAQLRAATRGARSLDDLVLEMYARRVAGKKAGLAQWRGLVRRNLGANGIADFEAMVAGKDIVPPANTFGPCLKPVFYQLRPFDVGFYGMSSGVVQELRPDSAAAAAGIQNGDKILSSPALLKAAQQREDAVLVLDLLRGEQAMKISYVPRRPQVAAWRWERAPAAKGGCKL